MKYFHFPTFLLAFILGLVFVYLSNPDLQTIFVYPTPDISDKLLYQDDSEICFKITPLQKPCSKKTKEYPMQGLLFNN